MSNELFLWNGPANGIAARVPTSTAWLFVAAETRDALPRMLRAAFGYVAGRDTVVRKYGYSGVWGSAMQGVDGEVGVWMQDSQNSTPYRVYPAPVAPRRLTRSAPSVVPVARRLQRSISG